MYLNVNVVFRDAIYIFHCLWVFYKIIQNINWNYKTNYKLVTSERPIRYFINIIIRYNSYKVFNLQNQSKGCQLIQKKADVWEIRIKQFGLKYISKAEIYKVQNIYTSLFPKTIVNLPTQVVQNILENIQGLIRSYYGEMLQ